MTSSAPAKSLRKWLSRWLALQTFTVLGLVCAVVYVATNLNLSSRQQALLLQKKEVIEHLVEEFAAKGDFPTLDHKLKDFFYGRPEFSLDLTIDGKRAVYGDSAAKDGREAHFRQLAFSLPSPANSDLRMEASLFLDTTSDRHLRAMLAWTLFACALVGAFVVSIFGDVLVRRALSALHNIGKQAEMLSPDRIGDRLVEEGLAVEIRPLVVQFNAVLQRLERAYVQMEGFNADVAHELRTPLATLIGETELALSTKRPSIDVREVLGSNLEELQRMSAIVNDMLFLSQADRGAQARVGYVGSLRPVVVEVLDYHEAEALDKGLTLVVSGDSDAYIDRSLFQRAISNLLSNAIRYSREGTTVKVTISSIQRNQLRIAVHNFGPTIDKEHLPRLFHRFYRSDPARSGEVKHHGLGLAIVAAIARMHGGRPFAESTSGETIIGLTISGLLRAEA